MVTQAYRLWCVEVTSPGCESVCVFYDNAAARAYVAECRRKYGEANVVGWELTG